MVGPGQLMPRGFPSIAMRQDRVMETNENRIRCRARMARSSWRTPSGGRQQPVGPSRDGVGSLATRHPLTQITDANLVRAIQPQCRRKVGLIDHKVVAAGGRGACPFGQLQAESVGIAIVDAASQARRPGARSR